MYRSPSAGAGYRLSSSARGQTDCLPSRAVEVTTHQVLSGKVEAHRVARRSRLCTGDIVYCFLFLVFILVHPFYHLRTFLFSFSLPPYLDVFQIRGHPSRLLSPLPATIRTRPHSLSREDISWDYYFFPPRRLARRAAW